MGIVTLDPGLNGLPGRLKRLRRERGWTLGQLAGATGLSKAYLGRLETADRQPSLAALVTLAQAFDLSVSRLLDEEQPCDEVVVRGASAVERRGNGLIYRALSPPDLRGGLQAMRVVVPADRAGQEMYEHTGEEWLYILAGTLCLSLGDVEVALGPGDAAQFDARTPHRLFAAGAEDVELLLVAAPTSAPVFSSYQAFRGADDD